MTAKTLPRPPEVPSADLLRPHTPPEDVISPRGWRHLRVRLPDGSEDIRLVPLTPADYLDPQEEDHVPEEPFHRIVFQHLFDLPSRYCARKRPAFTVFGDLRIEWPDPRLPHASPDVTVIPDVHDPERRRGTFYVDRESAAPLVAIEVISEQYRKEDRKDKVRIYERAQVPEYLLFDQRTVRGQVVNEVIGYRLEEGRYSPLVPNEDGVILSEAMGLWFGLESGRPLVIAMETGERLLTAAEEEARANAEAARAAAEAAARARAEDELARLRAELARLRSQS